MSEAIAILAAGSGSRFKSDDHKLLALVRGKPVISWVCEAVEDLDIDEVIVVTGAVDLTRLLPQSFTVIDNHSWRQGMATSLATAVDWAKLQSHSSVTIGLGDQPGITKRAWELVLTDKRKPISVATYGGQRRNPVRLESSIWGLLPFEGDEGARLLMSSRPELVSEVECDGSPWDIDTVEDLKKWN